MIKVGITGTIASGKSTICGMFESLGAYLIDADKLAKEVTSPKTSVYFNIIQLFGKEILNPDKSLNRKKIRDIIFTNPEKKKKLEEITHPAIVNKIRNICDAIEESETPMVIVEAALLFESDFYTEMDKNILVICDLNIQIDRLKKRDSITQEQAMTILTAQGDSKTNQQKADFIIDGAKSTKELAKDVGEIYKSCLIVQP